MFKKNIFSSRYIEPTTVAKKKFDQMETSTSTNARREAILIDLDEQSPIWEDKSTASELSYI